jgi:hypothetical protein
MFFDAGHGFEIADRSTKTIAPSRVINNIRAWKLVFVDAAQRMSQFIEGIAAPTFGDFGDGVRSGPRSLGDRERPRCLHLAHFHTNEYLITLLRPISDRAIKFQ